MFPNASPTSILSINNGTQTRSTEPRRPAHPRDSGSSQATATAAKEESRDADQNTPSTLRIAAPDNKSPVATRRVWQRALREPGRPCRPPPPPFSQFRFATPTFVRARSVMITPGVFC
ncbi:unnamed protein product [Diplocarpon coronariae]